MTIKNSTQTTIAISDICSTIASARPNTGYVVFSTGLLNTLSQSHGYDYQRLLEVAQREIIHLLAMNVKLFPLFSPAQNTTLKVFYTFLGALPVVSTPKVLIEAKAYFNCTNITSIPLVLNGSTYNWFPTVLFYDIMSDYVGNEGVERKLSRMTLALLEDSGWYTVNYTASQSSGWGYQ